jgi:hypothetical protein
MVVEGGDQGPAVTRAAPREEYTMQTGSQGSGFGKLKLVATLVVGLVMGGSVAAAPVVAETVASEAMAACSVDGNISTDTSEWAVPPSPGLPGEPY